MSDKTASSTIKTIALFSIGIVALLLRSVSISKNSLWLDEMTSLEVASQAIGDILSAKNFDSHTPPLYYVILKGWFSIFGKSETTLRSLSAFADMLNVMLIFLVSKRFLGHIKALIATAFYATSSFAIYFANEGRMYSLLILFVLTTIFFALRYFHTSLKRNLLLVAAVAILGIYLHYYYAIFLVGLTLGLTFEYQTQRKMLRMWWVLMVCVALCYLPWIGVLSGLTSGEGQVFRTFLFSVLPYAFFRFVAGYAVMPLTLELKQNMSLALRTHILELAPYFLLHGVSFALGCYALIKRKNWLIFFTLIAPPLLATLISLKIPMLGERYLVVIFPSFLLTCLIGFSEIKRIRLRNLAIGFALILHCYALMMHFSNSQFGFEQWRDAVTYINHQNQDAVVVVNPDFCEKLVAHYGVPEANIIAHNYVAKDGFSETLKQLHSHPNIQNSQQFVLIERGSAPSLETFFKSHGATIRSSTFFPFENGIRVVYFSLSPIGSNG